jgi:hypothetical protein
MPVVRRVLALRVCCRYKLVVDGKPRDSPDATDILNLLMLPNQPEISQYSAYVSTHHSISIRNCPHVFAAQQAPRSASTLRTAAPQPRPFTFVLDVWKSHFKQHNFHLWPVPFRAPNILMFSTGEWMGSSHTVVGTCGTLPP